MADAQAEAAVFKPALITRIVIALIAGALIPLTFSPNNMWLLGFPGVMGLYLALHGITGKQTV